MILASFEFEKNRVKTIMTEVPIAAVNTTRKPNSLSLDTGGAMTNSYLYFLSTDFNVNDVQMKMSELLM